MPRPVLDGVILRLISVILGRVLAEDREAAEDSVSEWNPPGGGDEDDGRSGGWIVGLTRLPHLGDH